MGTHYTVFYGSNPPAANDLVLNVYPDSSIAVLYYPEGDIGADTEEPANGAEPYSLPEGLPDYFLNENYPNPETDESFQLISSETSANGIGTHRYENAEGYSVTVSTNNGEPFQIAWADPEGNQDLIVSFDEQGVWTPSLYNSDEYFPEGETAVQEDAPPPARDEPGDETDLAYGLTEDPRYPNGVLTDETVSSGEYGPEAEVDRQYVHGVGWVHVDDIGDDHTMLVPPMPLGYARNDFLEDHYWTGVAWVPKDSVEEFADDVGDAAGDLIDSVIWSNAQTQSVAEQDSEPQAGEMPAGPEFTVPETPSIVPEEEPLVPVEVIPMDQAQPELVQQVEIPQPEMPLDDYNDVTSTDDDDDDGTP